MHSLDNGTSILKREIAAMPASIHRTTAWYSLLSNWHHPSKLPPYQFQSSMDLSSWMLKGSILTSSLNSERIPFLQNTLTISQTPSGPLILMVYYAVLCHHSPRRISLTFGQHPLYSVGDPYICATTLYGPYYHFHPRHSLHQPFASGRHLLMPEPSHPSHVIGSFVRGTAITSRS